MKFSLAEPTTNFALARLVSENEVWEVGCTPLLYGAVAIRAGKVGYDSVAIHYHLAEEKRNLARIVLAAVARILELLPESVTYQDAAGLLPSYFEQKQDWDLWWEKLIGLCSDSIASPHVPP